MIASIDLGSAYLRQGNIDQARKEFLTALSLDPKCTGAIGDDEKVRRVLQAAEDMAGKVQSGR